MRSYSDVFDQYDAALGMTRARLETRAAQAHVELEAFYHEFLKNHICRYRDRFERADFRSALHSSLVRRFGTKDIRFWAVDGACMNVEAADLVIFYGGAYAVKGSLDVSTKPPLVEYHESEPEDDSSLVAYLPLSPEDLVGIDPQSRFIVDDTQRMAIGGLDRALMLLAEVYMCFRGASNPDGPHLILWDHSISSVLANATPNATDIRFSGISIGGEQVWYPDLLVGYSRPWNSILDVPSGKAQRLYERLIRDIFISPTKSVSWSSFVAATQMEENDVRPQVSRLWECDRHGRRHSGRNPDTALVMREGDTLRLNPTYATSPEKVQRLFQHFCQKFFHDKDPSVLVFEYEDDDGLQRSRFMSLDEIQFLLAIGLRLTFEACWRRDVMFLGIAKDSASTYYTRNYFGILASRTIPQFDAPYSFVPRLIPGTDRLCMEMATGIDETIRAPWASTEFDSTFMTLRLRRELGTSRENLQGVRGFVLTPPNLIMRSLAQFYLNRDFDREPAMGHVVFLDRLVNPSHPPPDRIPVTKGHRDLGTVAPFWVKDQSIVNDEQEVAIYLLSVLTKNVFAEVIGYPDPLHHADRGAKSVLHMVEPMLRSSEKLNRSNPIFRTLRQNRGG